MTWRERVAVARTNGDFEFKDYCDWMSIERCPAAEAVKGATGVERIIGSCGVFTRFRPAFDLGDRMRLLMDNRDFAGADALIDRIEDLVLTIKREETK